MWKLERNGLLVPQGPEDPHGASAKGDPMSSPLSGHYHTLPAGTQLPPGLGIVGDGQDVGGSRAPTHHTIYPSSDDL